MKPDRRGSWYILTGLVLGVAAGLIYSWVISPVKYLDAPPYSLRADYKDEYRALVAAAYMYSHDLLRAQGRLAQLKDNETAQTIVGQAQRALANGHPAEEVKALNLLAAALGGGVTPEGGSMTPSQQSSSIPTTSEVTPTPLIIDPTASPTPTLPASATTINILLMISTNTPQPTRTATPSPTPGAPFILQETRMVCNINQPAPLIQVEIRDAAGQPVPSIEVSVTWNGGEDHFFTGLQPEMGLGYGDFVMTPDIAYSIHLKDGDQPVEDLTAAECTAEDNSRYWGSWYLVFVQP